MDDPTLVGQSTKLIINALEFSGQRRILTTGWNGLSKIDHIPDDMFIIESAPYSWLFPQMAVVTHHRCAGTIVADLRAGIPGIIPSSHDQFVWVCRVYELGVGPNSIPRKKTLCWSFIRCINLAKAMQ